MTSRSLDLPGLAAVQLPDTEGHARVLGEYWADRPVALIFLRHFG